MLDRIRNYLTYSSFERNGLIVLLLLILVVMSFLGYRSNFSNNTDQFKFVDLKSLLEPSKDSVIVDDGSGLLLQNFDPNKLDQSGWEKLGFTQKQAASIINYRSKAGRFNNPEDLLKLYVVDTIKYDQIKDFIHIIKHQKKNHSLRKLNINSCDSTELLKLPGIGSYRANKILKFRRALGGFCSKQQLSETYGLNDETFEKIKNQIFVKVGSWRLLDINVDSQQTLGSHPYISEQTAESIVFMRETVGSFLLTEDLVSMDLISVNLYVKLQPYLRPVE
ncbi:MAG: hypothetical protein HOH13_03755 [Crocinitomicaceae bacterium]|mgnify:FL=1|nr:hypothetical protein [Crocinitomicaceae bacterium]